MPRLDWPEMSGSYSLYVVEVVLGLAMLMVVHECGHFFIARAFGMRVTKFSIGFGPPFFKVVPEDGYFWFMTAADHIRLRLWKHDPARHGPTIYQVAMIPFLAYVQIAGMNPLEDVDEGDAGSYANASLTGRILTIFGGPLANYLFASVLFFLSLFIGGHKVRSTEVSVLPDRPAAAASMKTGDKIVEIGGVHVDEFEEMADVISEHPGRPLPVVVDRGGQRVDLTVTPARDDHGKGKIGVASTGSRKIVLTWKESAQLALKMPTLVVKNMVMSIGQLVSGKAEGELSGPVGMVKVGAQYAQAGWLDLLLFLAELSAYLGAFNLLPFPALDGGRLMFLGYEATTRRRPNARIEAHIHFIGLAMMLGLMVYVTVNDIRRPEVGPAAAPGASGSAAASSQAPPGPAPSAPSAGTPPGSPAPQEPPSPTRDGK
jgi:regulator of sigma E protease